MRGEDAGAASTVRGGDGAPPRACGGRRSRASSITAMRSTPTCVGRTRRPSLSRPVRTEHPHVRGEDVVGVLYEPPLSGAPPRAWGGLRWQPRPVQPRRSTPTCVGRTPGSAPPPTSSTEHPHVRGEDLSSEVASTGDGGAPPRAWGGPASTRRATAPGRSTPTCVGRTTRGSMAAWSASEHPHVRGEEASPVKSTSAAGGAPPRAWGGLSQSARLPHLSRSTPTCVGRTGRAGRCPPAPTEHPHVRGEDGYLLYPGRVHTGAPPRAWGGRR